MNELEETLIRRVRRMERELVGKDEMMVQVQKNMLSRITDLEEENRFVLEQRDSLAAKLRIALPDPSPAPVAPKPCATPEDSAEKKL